MAEVRLQNVSKHFGKTPAVVDMDLTVPDGAFVVLLGPTGAGKTTTLRLIAGLEKADAGTIQIGGRTVNIETPAQRDVAMVFQQYSLYPHMTVRENLAFPLRSPILKTPENEIARKVQEVAEVLHIPHKLDNKATELSGGVRDSLKAVAENDMSLAKRVIQLKTRVYREADLANAKLRHARD